MGKQTVIDIAEHADLEEPSDKELIKYLSMFDRRINDIRFNKLDIKMDKVTDETIKLRETVNNGLTHKVKTLHTLFFWFFGIYLTTTMGILTAMGYLIKLMMSMM